MGTVFRAFNSTYYDTVCDFLIEISRDDHKLINWNWARWELMVFHPEFHHDLADKIGLWLSSSNELIGMTTYDHYLGEAFYATKKGYEELEKEILDYAINNFSDKNGLSIAVNDADSDTKHFLLTQGFVKDANTENILECIFEGFDFNYSIPKGIAIKNLNPKTDLYKHQKVLWKGFENEGTMPTDELTINKQKRMLSAPHLNSTQHIVAENEEGEYIAYCGCWYSSHTDYAYVEPLCTIPDYRHKGLGRAVLLEALNRCYS